MTNILELPWPPSLNHLYPTGKNGRRFLSKAGKLYHDQVIYAVRQTGYCLRKRYVLPVALSIWVFPPNNIRRDISNLIKIIEDSLTLAGVWKDDSQVYEEHVYKRHVVKGGRVDIEVHELGVITKEDFGP